MKNYLLILFLTFSQFVFAQNIINAVMVGDKGVTEDAKKAKFLIVLKSYGDTAFERLEYNFIGPMKRRLTYKDPLLKILDGSYTNFLPSGYIERQGNYVDNKKEGSWLLYNDSAKAKVEYKYHLDTLVAVLNLDSLNAERKKIHQDTTGEREAEYNGGQANYLKYIYKNLKVPERTQALEAGGTVRVNFIVNKEGGVTNVRVTKSVQFVFDQEVIRVVSSATDWIRHFKEVEM